MNHIQQLPTPHPGPVLASEPEFAASRGLPRRFPSGDPEAARRAYYVKKAEWSKLNLRQSWADEDFMRAHIKAAGLRVVDSWEPATATRLKSLLRRAGVHAADIAEDIGTDLDGYLKLNPDLPLWAALALILEATGRFNPEVSA